MRGPGLAVARILFTTAVVTAQELQFEVASIKLNPEARGGRFVVQPGGRLTATALPASGLIQRSDGVQPYQLEGLPDWATRQRFDVQAKAPESDAPLQRQQLLAMMRQLLAERFGLQIHRDTRVRQVYLLQRERTDRPLAAGFTPSATECTNRRAEDVGASPGCGIFARAETAGVTLVYQARTMAQFANDLTGRVGRPVIDRTGIEGQFDVQLRIDRPPSDAPDPNAAATTFTTVREQLGLRLVAGNAPIDVIVVDAIHPPTPD